MDWAPAVEVERHRAVALGELVSGSHCRSMAEEFLCVHATSQKPVPGMVRRKWQNVFGQLTALTSINSKEMSADLWGWTTRWASAIVNG